MGELTKAGTNPLVPVTGECFIVVPLHGWMLESGAWSLSVFQLVGTVAKPAPDLQWHEPEKPSS